MAADVAVQVKSFLTFWAIYSAMSNGSTQCDPVSLAFGVCAHTWFCVCVCIGMYMYMRLCVCVLVDRVVVHVGDTGRQRTVRVSFHVCVVHSEIHAVPACMCMYLSLNSRVCVCVCLCLCLCMCVCVSPVNHCYCVRMASPPPPCAVSMHSLTPVCIHILLCLHPAE